MSFSLAIHASPYPQRIDDFEPSWLNRMSERIRISVGTRWGMKPQRLDALVKQVNNEGKSWLDEFELDAKLESPWALPIKALQRSLRRDGFVNDEVTARLLSIVCRAAEKLLGMTPHTNQIAAAYVLLRGHVVEMDTGEGKSLTAALAAACAALAGIKVHVITVNDYLAERDCQSFSAFYGALGLSVGGVTETMGLAERQVVYACDVVYCANKVIVFDYLRDRMTFSAGMRPLGLALERLAKDGVPVTLLPGLQFAIVDEVDSVFVDEARTPLVISANDDDAERVDHYREAIFLARQLVEGDDFVIADSGRLPRLTESGRDRLARLAAPLGGLWLGPRLREDGIHQALVALWVFRRDIDYIVQDGKAMIVDENTGRVMPDRSWERGLQQLIEIKEDLEPTPIRDNLARLSYQLFFRRYLHLSGMSGTCREVATEFAEVYGLGVVRIEPFKPNLRRYLPTLVYPSSREKWECISNTVAELHRRGQPVLVGTRSIKASEELSEHLMHAGIPHQILNAKQNAQEAEIVARAGEWGQVTIATNMAGRGTDIKLDSCVKEIGGLFVIVSEGHDNDRVDRQLAGRCARQGDPGACQRILAYDDEVTKAMPRVLYRMLVRMMKAYPDKPWVRWVALGGYRLAQRHIAFRHRLERRRLLSADFNSRKTLAFSGEAE